MNVDGLNFCQFLVMRLFDRTIALLAASEMWVSKLDLVPTDQLIGLYCVLLY